MDTTILPDSVLPAQCRVEAGRTKRRDPRDKPLGPTRAFGREARQEDGYVDVQQVKWRRDRCCQDVAHVDPEVSDAIEAAGNQMIEVVDALTEFSLTTPEPTVTDASSSAQAAFRQLLRLRSAEQDIQRSQSRGGQGSGQQNRSMQEQLNQLELDNDRNRYETEQQAQQDSRTDEQRDQLQVLSRLRELARRQKYSRRSVAQKIEVIALLAEQAWHRHLMPVGKWKTPEGTMHGLANGQTRVRGKMSPIESHDGPDDAYPDGLITDTALEELDRLSASDSPFFLAVGLYTPHFPNYAPTNRVGCKTCWRWSCGAQHCWAGRPLSRRSPSW